VADPTEGAEADRERSPATLVARDTARISKKLRLSFPPDPSLLVACISHPRGPSGSPELLDSILVVEVTAEAEVDTVEEVTAEAEADTVEELTAEADTAEELTAEVDTADSSEIPQPSYKIGCLCWT
jgi:hypothetical protein